MTRRRSTYQPVPRSTERVVFTLAMLVASSAGALLAMIGILIGRLAS